MMTEACTILCLRADYAAVEDAVRRSSPNYERELSEGRLKRLTLVGPQGSLRLTMSEWTAPGTELSKMLLGMVTWVGRIPLPDMAFKRDLQGFIASCHFAVGIVADPSIDVDPRFRRCVSEVAREISGIIFDGLRIVDATGALVVDSTGNAGVRVKMPEPA